ncbi:MAG: hypothetical protein R2748_01270 [Bryobacterales bacterium]
MHIARGSSSAACQGFETVARTRYDWERVTDQYEELFRSLVKR